MVCRPVRGFGAAPKADMEQLSEELHGMVDQLRPSREEQERQKQAFQQVQSTLQQEWPDAQVHLFGSTANCLSICNNNDIDVCLELPDSTKDQVGVVAWVGHACCNQLSRALLARSEWNLGMMWARLSEVGFLPCGHSELCVLQLERNVG